MRAALQNFQKILIAYGPWGVFLLSFIDSFGVPLPAAMDVTMIGFAANCVRDPRRAYLTAVLAILGSVIGNIGLYMAAQRGAHWLAREQPVPGKRHRVRELFHRFGLLTVFVPAATPFLPLPLKFFVISAGALRAPFGRFVAVILLARMVRFGGEAYLGLKLGEAGAKNFLLRHGWMLAVMALAVCLVGYLTMRLLERGREVAQVEHQKAH